MINDKFSRIEAEAVIRARALLLECLDMLDNPQPDKVVSVTIQAVDRHLLAARQHIAQLGEGYKTRD